MNIKLHLRKFIFRRILAKKRTNILHITKHKYRKANTILMPIYK